MKIFKIFSILLFVLICNALVAQANHSYVKSSIERLNTLFDHKKVEKLSDAQVLKLEKILAVKEVKFNKINKSGFKSDIANEMSKLDREFASQIEAILNKNQISAYRTILNQPITQ
jgi:hypothetical protein